MGYCLTCGCPSVAKFCAECAPFARAAYEQWTRNGDPNAKREDNERRHADLTANAKRRARTRYALDHPRKCDVDPDLARGLALMDAHFPDTSCALTRKPVYDWDATPVARPDDERTDEPKPVADRSPIRTRTHDAQTVGARYLVRLIEGEYEAVAHAQVGDRNPRLNHAAFRYGQAIGADVLDHADAVALLEEAAAKCGLPYHEVRATIRSGLNAGRAHPLETRQ